MTKATGWDFVELMRTVELKYSEEEVTRKAWDGEKPDILTALIAIAKALQPAPSGSEEPTPTRFSLKKCIGVGGTGVVILAEDSRFNNRRCAIKFPRPSSENIEVIAELVAKEISLLATLRHPGIVRVLDFGILKNVGKYTKLPFYVMEFVEGIPSQKYFRASSRPTKDLLRAVSQLAETLGYLHTAAKEATGTDGRPGVVYFDLKPDNVMITDSGVPILIDFGSCKTIGEETRKTFLAGTEGYLDPDIEKELQPSQSGDKNRRRGPIPGSLITRDRDFWPFAKTILSWMGYDQESGLPILTSKPSSETPSPDEETPPPTPYALLANMTSYDRKYLLLLIARLMAWRKVPPWLLDRIQLPKDMLTEIKIQTMAQVCNALARLDGSYNPLDRIPELNDSHAQTLQAGPGLDLPFTPALKELYEHPLFRRLSHITQLGMISTVYPTAKHARREHSLGTYGNVGLYVRALYGDPTSPLFRQIVTEEDVRAVLLLALVHDLGQYPFAHDLEDVDQALFSHVDLTSVLLGLPAVETPTFKLPPEVPSMEPVLACWATSRERLAQILHAKVDDLGSTAFDKLLRSLISGPLDCDKLDYLQRDSRNCDVVYPRGIDVDMLLRCLTVTYFSKLEDRPGSNLLALAVHDKGLMAGESVHFARRAMFRNVYWHHAARGQVAKLRRAVLALLYKKSPQTIGKTQSEFLEFVVSLPESLAKGLKSAPSPGSAQIATSAGKSPTSRAVPELQLTDSAVVHWIRTQLDKEGKPGEADLLRRIRDRKEWFKRLWVMHHDDGPALHAEICDHWAKCDRDKLYRSLLDFENRVYQAFSKKTTSHLSKMTLNAAKGWMKSAVENKMPWLLVDVPTMRSGSDIGLYFIPEMQRRAQRKDDRVCVPARRSTFWEMTAKNLHLSIGKLRVFAHPDITESLEDAFPEPFEGFKWLLAALQSTQSG